MKVTNKIDIHLDDLRHIPPINVMQADAYTRVLEFSLYSGGQAWNVPEGVDVAVAYIGSSGKGIYDTLPDGTAACDVNGNVVTAVVAPQAVAMDGNTNLNIIFTDGEGHQLAAFCVTLKVERNPAVNATKPPDYINLRQWLSKEIRELLTYYVHVEPDGDGGYFTDSVMDDVLQACASDAPVICRLELPMEPENLQLPLAKHDDSTAYFSTVFEGKEYMVTITADGVTVEISECGGGNSGGNADYVGVEPTEDDIPKVFFGGPLQQTKDEKVVPFRYISKTEDISGYAEIKAQGNSSMGYPKKNQTVKMFKDADCTEKLKVYFKGWGKQNKHCYKANWIDLTHARNVVSARLWADVVKSRTNYAELPELLKTSPNMGAVDGFPIKVYADGVYQGRYTLNIPKDKWAFNMDDKLEEHCVLCGEGFTSGCFRAANMGEWTDEIHDVCPESIKTRWVEVIDFVMNSTDEEFKANLDSYIDVASLIDYDLFGLASCGIDAYGKNQLYITYDGQKWYASMYDMDATWGLYWNGGFFNKPDLSRELFEDRKNGREGNLLYIRLEQNFAEEMQTRWAELKAGALSIANIINRFERFTDIASAELVAEDYAETTGGGAFTGIPCKTTNNIQQIRAFALSRQQWLDEYMFPVRCTGITLNPNTLAFTGAETQTLTATVEPENTTDTITWESNNTSVATVSNGIVTAVANGSAVITAKCGNHSASCTVSVSGIVEPVPCTGVTLSETSIELNVDAATGIQGTYTLIATVTPEDTTDVLSWRSDNNTVATVENGIVTAIAEGNATITATCGSRSATCAVVVSGVEADPIHPLENGTFSKSTNTLTTDESGHITLSSSSVDWAINLPLDHINTVTAVNNASNRSEAVFNIPAGSKVDMMVKDIRYSDDVEINSEVYFNILMKDSANKEWKCFLSNIMPINGTDEVKGTTLTLTEDLDVYGVYLWHAKFAGTVDMDFRMYVDGVRWI